jgi:hypothetical protein
MPIFSKTSTRAEATLGMVNNTWILEHIPNTMAETQAQVQPKRTLKNIISHPNLHLRIKPK